METNESRPINKLIIPGVGIDGIKLLATTGVEIEAKYGNEFTLINHNNYSYEMCFDYIGISCYYKYADPRKLIFSILLRPRFEAYTKEGFDLNSDVTIMEVVDVYGMKSTYSLPENSDYAYLDYGGIQFYVKKADALFNVANYAKIRMFGIR